MTSSVDTDPTMNAAVNEEKAIHKAKLEKQLRKTRLCVHWLAHGCQWGEKCTFAHGHEELERAPDLRRTKLCKAFAAGECTDSRCTFAHGDQELRWTDQFYKRSLCFWFVKGKCNNGNRCRFAHGASDIRNQDSKHHIAPEQDLVDTPSGPVAASTTGDFEARQMRLPLAGLVQEMRTNDGDFPLLGAALDPKIMENTAAPEASQLPYAPWFSNKVAPPYAHFTSMLKTPPAAPAPQIQHPFATAAVGSLVQPTFEGVPSKLEQVPPPYAQFTSTVKTPLAALAPQILHPFATATVGSLVQPTFEDVQSKLEQALSAYVSQLEMHIAANTQLMAVANTPQVAMQQLASYLSKQQENDLQHMRNRIYELGNELQLMQNVGGPAAVAEGTPLAAPNCGYPRSLPFP